MRSLMPTKRWKNQAEYYRRFVKGEKGWDFSDEAARVMFLYESRGDLNLKSNNGFFRGKMLQDITVKMWKEDLGLGQLSILELMDDGYAPEFLTRVLA